MVEWVIISRSLTRRQNCHFSSKCSASSPLGIIMGYISSFPPALEPCFLASKQPSQGLYWRKLWCLPHDVEYRQPYLLSESQKCIEAIAHYLIIQALENRWMWSNPKEQQALYFSSHLLEFLPRLSESEPLYCKMKKVYSS